MVLGVTESASALRGLQELFPEWVSLDESHREKVRTDYGRWMWKTAGAVWALLCWTGARWLQSRRTIEPESEGA